MARGPPAVPKAVSTPRDVTGMWVLTSRGPRAAPCPPGSRGAVSALAGEEDVGFCLPSAVCCILHSPCLYIFVIYGARDDILRSLELR